MAPTVTSPTKLALVHRVAIGVIVGGKGVAAGAVCKNVGTAGCRDVGASVDSGGSETVAVGLAASSVSWATAVPPAARVSSAAMVWAAAVKMASRASAVGEGAAGTQALRKPMTDPIKIPVQKICLFIGIQPALSEDGRFLPLLSSDIIASKCTGTKWAWSQPAYL